MFKITFVKCLTKTQHISFDLYFIHDRINKYTKLMCYLVSFSSMNNSWIFIKESHDSPWNFANSVNIDFLSSDNSYFETSTQIWILRQESCGSLIGHERFRWCRWTCYNKKQLFALSKNFKWTFATSMWFILQVITESLPWQKGFYFLNSATKSGQTSYSVILGILQILQSSKTTISCMFIEVFKCYKCLMWAFSIYLLFLKFWNHSKIKVFLP